MKIDNNDEVSTGFSWFRIVLILAGAFILFFIIAPILSMMFHTPMGELAKTTSDKEVIDSIWLTVWVALLSTLTLSIAAIPLAYLLSRYNFPFRGLINAIIDMPIVIPHSVVGIALLCFFAGEGLLGKALENIGIKIIDTPIGIGVAMAFVGVPFLINSAREGFAQIPIEYEKAAYTLGASPAQVFFTISLPLAWRSVITGLVMMFARGMSEFGAVIMVAYHPMVASVLIFDRFNAFGLKYSQPIALLFLLVSLALFVVLGLLVQSNKKHA